LLRDDRLLLFGYSDYPGAEHEVLVRRDLAGLPAEQIRGRPEQAAEQALARVGAAGDWFLLHLDVDVVDFFDRARAVTTGGKELQVAEPSDPPLRPPTQDGSGFESPPHRLPSTGDRTQEVRPRDDASPHRRCDAPVGDGSACATVVAANLLPGAGDPGTAEGGSGP
jgi:hypothetical protein